MRYGAAVVVMASTNRPGDTIDRKVSICDVPTDFDRTQRIAPEDIISIEHFCRRHGIETQPLQPDFIEARPRSTAHAGGHVSGGVTRCVSFRGNIPFGEAMHSVFFIMQFARD